MKNNRKIWVYLLLLIVIIAVIIFSLGQNKNSQKIKIGIILPLTGPAASVAEDLYKTIKMYESQSKNLEFIIQDDQCSGKNALSAYNILKNQGIKIYMAACSGSILALAPVAKEDGNVVLTGFGGSTEIRKTGDEVIRFIPDGLSIALGMVDVIKNNPDKKYVILYEQHDYPKSAVEIISSKVGGQIVDKIAYSSDANSYKTEILKLKSINFDEIIFIPVAEKNRQIILKEMSDLGINKNILGDVNTCDRLDLFKDTKFHGSCLKAVLKGEGYDKYISEFKSKYNNEPTYPFYNAVTFDILKFIDFDLAGLKSNNLDIVSKIKKDTLDGVAGQSASYEFEQNGEVISKQEYLEVVNF